MSILLTCLAIALLMPYLAKAPLIIAMAREGNGYDNKHPREQQARLTGIDAALYCEAGSGTGFVFPIRRETVGSFSSRPTFAYSCSSRIGRSNTACTPSALDPF
jgi:hypothetical protein